MKSRIISLVCAFNFRCDAMGSKLFSPYCMLVELSVTEVAGAVVLFAHTQVVIPHFTRHNCTSAVVQQGRSKVGLTKSHNNQTARHGQFCIQTHVKRIQEADYAVIAQARLV